jgi:hypothetical protein
MPVGHVVALDLVIEGNWKSHIGGGAYVKGKNMD